VPAVATRCRMCGHQFSSQEDSSSTESPVDSHIEQPVEAPIIEQSIIEQPVNEPSFTESIKADNSFESVEKHNSFEEGNSSQSPSFDDSSDQRVDLSSKNKAKPLNFGPEPIKPPVREERGFEEPEHGSSFEKESKGHTESNLDKNELASDPKRKKRKRKRKKKTNENTLRDSSHDNESSHSENRDSRAEERNYEYEKREDSKRKTNSKSNNVSRDSSTGILVGWLVSYSNNSNGFSIELRTGKFFVAKQKLREDDLIIPDSAISTPHCLIKVSKGSLQVQDLMSENGTTVKKKGTNSYVPSDEVSAVEHGDKLKFGAYELSVCLVSED